MPFLTHETTELRSSETSDTVTLNAGMELFSGGTWTSNGGYRLLDTYFLVKSLHNLLEAMFTEWIQELTEPDSVLASLPFSHGARR